NYVLFHDKQNGRTYNSENIDFGGVKLLDCSIYGADESLYCILYSTFSDEDKAKIGNSPVFTEADRKKLVEFQEEDNPLIIFLK
ncbi:MAG: hypothetical protein LBQ01_06245, partial [Prevotellaceae bacterium]|nr:hypothetical protein [Prevotellaceae bacterium]